MQKSFASLPWLVPGQDFPPGEQAWGDQEAAPGLLAAGGALDVPTLLRAYGAGVFPWFSAGQPVLWWSPDPRMVLRPMQLRLHPSLRKTLRRFIRTPGCQVTFAASFAAVIGHCSQAARSGQNGTWIVPEMVQAYTALHRAGYAHSVETWIDGALVGGLYAVHLGGIVFGESMFSLRTDASKIALAALVAFCLEWGIEMIDCQQNTEHLASLGAAPVPRAAFLAHVRQQALKPTPPWHFEAAYWNHILKARV